MRKFWSFSESGTYGARWDIKAVDSDWSWKMRVRLRRGEALQEVKWPDPPPLYTYEKVKRFEDLPWPLDKMHIVSDRLRAFIETEAPGAAQFFPIRLEGPRSDEIPYSYWAVNWVRIFDCLDEDASYNVDDTGKRYVEVPVIDPSRIPNDGVLGLLGGYTVITLIRDDLKKKMQKAKFTGPQFYPIASIDRPSTITWKKVDWSKPHPL